MNAALLAFAKPPVPGRVKTRLTPPLAPEEAACLYGAFLGDALDQYRDLGATLRLYLALDEPSLVPHKEFKNALVSASALCGLNQRILAYPEWMEAGSIFRQEGAGLGERMKQAFEETFAAGADSAMLIGTDHPTLPSAWIREGFSLLETPGRIVLGPTGDGGFYLLGMNRFFPQLFEGMTYSHDAVFEQTADRAALCGASLHALPAWYDVDTFDDLKRLAADLQQENVSARRTRVMLRRLAQRYEYPG